MPLKVDMAREEKKPKKRKRLTKAEKKQKKKLAKARDAGAPLLLNLSDTDRLVVANIRALLIENGGAADLPSVCRYLPGGRPDIERLGFKIDGDVVRLKREEQPKAEEPGCVEEDTVNDSDSSGIGAGTKQQAKQKATKTPQKRNVVDDETFARRATELLSASGGKVQLSVLQHEFPGWDKKQLKGLQMFEFCDGRDGGLLVFRDVERALELFARALPEAGGDGEKRGAGTNSATGTHFADLPLLYETRMALKKAFKHERMTLIQEQALLPILRERDVLAKAQTGSGKTLAFLVPLVELLKNHAFFTRRRIHNLVVVPTRELATQIFDEITKLATFFTHSEPSPINLSADKGMLKTCCKMKWKLDFVVSTPGRLCNMIRRAEPFQVHLKALRTLVFDEADQLLEKDFEEELSLIVAALPKKRQTLLFSATFNKTVMLTVKETLRPDYKELDAIGESAAVPEQIEHSYAVTSMKRLTRDLWRLLRHQMEKVEDFKIMVFFQTVRMVQFYASLFRNSKLSRHIMEIHGKMHQETRTQVTRKFRNGASRILFSSDVSSRGMDYPDVTCVLQVGIPQSRDIYLHRLGRTGRAGKAGENILLLLNFELPFLRKVQDIPILTLEMPDIETEDCPDPSVVPDPSLKRRVYASWLGYMCHQNLVELPHEELVSRANRYAKSVLGCSEPPSLLRAPLEKMGLPEDTPGLTLVDLIQEDYAGGRPYFVEGVNAIALGAPDDIGSWDAQQASGANAQPMGDRENTPLGLAALAGSDELSPDPILPVKRKSRPPADDNAPAKRRPRAKGED